MSLAKWREADKQKDVGMYINKIYLDFKFYINYVSLIKHVGDYVVSTQDAYFQCTYTVRPLEVGEDIKYLSTYTNGFEINYRR